jgi:hypothetical protein
MICESLSLHTLLLGLSLLAAIVGLTLLMVYPAPEDANEQQITTEHLLRMIFVYWAVYCVTSFAQKLLLPTVSELTLPLKLTGVFSYLLTFASLLCLPLHFIEARRQIQKG